MQLTDLHINKYMHPEIVPDLLAFGDQVLRGVQPQALLITGDLVDAKTRAEGSQQHPQEWQVGVQMMKTLPSQLLVVCCTCLYFVCVWWWGGGGWQAHRAQEREGGVSWGGGDRVFAKTRAEGSQQHPEVAGVRSLCSGLHSLLFLFVLPLTGVGWLGGGARAEGSQQHPEEWQVGVCKCSEPAHLYCTYFLLVVRSGCCVCGGGGGADRRISHK